MPARFRLAKGTQPKTYDFRDSSEPAARSRLSLEGHKGLLQLVQTPFPFNEVLLQGTVLEVAAWTVSAKGLLGFEDGTESRWIAFPAGDHWIIDWYDGKFVGALAVTSDQSY